MPDSVIKDPQALLDYQFDWSDWLSADGDTITDHTVTVSTGLTLENSTRSSTAVTAWISGGTIGAFRYVVLYNDTATGDPLIGWWDYGSVVCV